jgi:hypothetical protein
MEAKSCRKRNRVWHALTISDAASRIMMLNFIYQTGVFATVVLDPKADSVV